MKSFKIDNKGDLVIEGGDLVMVEKSEELAQSLERILTTNTTEWFLDLGFGLRYEDIQGKGKDKELVKLAIREALFQDVRVREVIALDVHMESDRHLNISGKVIDGNGNIVNLSDLEGVEI